MRIKKTSQTTPIQAQVVNTQSNSTTDSYSCDYVNNNFAGKGIVLWENQSPTSSFAGQTIALNSNNYDYFIVLTYNNTSQKMIINNGLFPKGENCSIDQCATGGNNDYGWIRTRMITYVDDTHLQFLDGKAQKTNANGHSTDNTVLIPIKIIGIKL